MPLPLPLKPTLKPDPTPPLSPRPKQVNKQTRKSLTPPFATTVDTAIVPSGGAPANIIAPDVAACGVIVHGIDGVLVPNLSGAKPRMVGGGVPASGGYGYGWH